MYVKPHVIVWSVIFEYRQNIYLSCHAIISEDLYYNIYNIRILYGILYGTNGINHSSAFYGQLGAGHHLIS